mgnify:CR=1 FL=1
MSWTLCPKWKSFLKVKDKFFILICKPRKNINVSNLEVLFRWNLQSLLPYSQSASKREMVKTAFLFLTFSTIVFAINGGYGQYHLQSKWLYLFFYYFGRTPTRTRHETLVKYYNKKEGKQKKKPFLTSVLNLLMICVCDI